MTTPTADGFHMPPEWAPHAGCWMAWPCHQETFETTIEAARDAYAGGARAIAQFEPLTMLANPDHVTDAALRCGDGVTVMEVPLNDSWMRDIGPTFVVDGKGGIAGVDWRFNAWGGNYPDHARDEAVAGSVMASLGVVRYPAPIVMEGGALHTDGAGTLITTTSVVLNDNRNPGLTRDDAEAVFRDFVGTTRTIWLEDALEYDDTDGHVDNLACFLAEGVVAAMAPGEQGDAMDEALAHNLKTLAAATDSQGRRLSIVPLPRPRRVLWQDVPVPASYVNFYPANGALIIPSFDDPMDRVARDRLSEAMPDRTVVQLPALEIVKGGGGIHCITQQQPAVS